MELNGSFERWLRMVVINALDDAIDLSGNFTYQDIDNDNLVTRILDELLEAARKKRQWVFTTFDETLEPYYNGSMVKRLLNTDRKKLSFIIRSACISKVAA